MEGAAEMMGAVKAPVEVKLHSKGHREQNICSLRDEDGIAWPLIFLRAVVPCARHVMFCVC